MKGLMIRLEVSPAQSYEYEGEGDPPIDTTKQPEIRTLGPFDYVQQTYCFLRVGPKVGPDGVEDYGCEGEHIASYSHEDGFWQTLAGLPGLPPGELYTDFVIHREENL